MAEAELHKTPLKEKKCAKYEQKFKIEYRDEFQWVQFPVPHIYFGM